MVGELRIGGEAGVLSFSSIASLFVVLRVDEEDGEGDEVGTV